MSAMSRDLPNARCVTSLGFPEIDIPARIPDQYSPHGYRSDPENRLAVPAVLKIAAACGALQTLELNAEYGIPCTEPVMRRNVRDASAVALSHFRFSAPSKEARSGCQSPLLCFQAL
jgi:hypothetical protein